MENRTGGVIWLRSGSQETRIPGLDLMEEKHRHHGSDSQERAEGKIFIPPQSLERNQGQSRHGADGCPDQDGQQDRLPAEERADHGQKLDVAAAHAFLAEQIGAEPGHEPVCAA